jgi:hypothetical protein
MSSAVYCRVALVGNGPETEFSAVVPGDSARVKTKQTKIAENKAAKTCLDKSVLKYPENKMSSLTWFKRLELIASGLIFGLFNNVSTILNSKVLLESGHQVAGGLTIFFLLFPGLITSVGFVVLHWLGHKKIGRIPPISVLFYFLLLLFAYPLVPILW